MMRAIDISTAQRHVDFDRVRAAGIRGVWIKASEGIGTTRARVDYFRTQARAAKAAGLYVGAYHFDRLGDLAREHDRFRASVGDIELTLPTWLDIEPSSLGGGVYAYPAGRPHTIEELDERSARWGELEPGSWLYGYASMLRKRELWSLPLVVASRPWGDDPPPSDLHELLDKQPSLDWRAWQYASRAGRIDGVTDRRGRQCPVDLVLVRQSWNTRH